MTSQPLRNRSRWSLDYSRNSKTNPQDLACPPGKQNCNEKLNSLIIVQNQKSIFEHEKCWFFDFSGYSTSINALHAEASRQSDATLKAKRSWDLALGPMKQVILSNLLSKNFVKMISLSSQKRKIGM